MSVTTWPKGAPRLYDNVREQHDFITRLGIAETIKATMRRHYACATRGAASFEDMARRAGEFWPAYDEVNTRWTPEDPVYSKVVTGVALTTSNDYWELGAAAAGQLRILESFIGGENTVSAATRVTISRVTSQGTGTTPTAYTPEKFSTRSPAAAGTYYGAVGAQVAWGTTQATLSANSLVLHVFNAFGGSDRWVAQPGEEIYCVNAEFVSMRSLTGTSTCSAMVVVEEL
jgi:hypothetical protein